MRPEQRTQVDRPSPNAGWHRSIGPFLVLAFAGAMVAAVWWTIVTRIGERERDALSGTERNLTNLALAFDEGLARSIKTIDQAMVAVRSEFIRAGLTPEVRRLIEIMGQTDPLLISVGIADAKGDVVFAPSAGSNAAGPINAADRLHFNAHLEPGTDRLYISPPSVGRLSGKWVVFLSRRITRADGSFGGVVIATIDAVKLGDFYTKVDLGPQGVVAVIGLDGIARVRVDGMARARFGDDLRAQPALKLAASAPAGSYRFVGVIDGQERIFSYRAIQGLPLIVIIGAAVDDVLREPLRYARNAHLLGGALTLAILAVTGLIQLHLRLASRRERELAHQAALQGAIFSSLDEGMSVFDRDLRLTGWNDRFASIVGLDPVSLHAGMTLRQILILQARAGEFGVCDPETEADRRLAALWPDRSIVTERTRPNGRTIELRRSPIPSGGYVTIYADVTERKANEQTLKDLNETLEHRVEERTAALTASERRLARAQAIAKVGHWVWTGAPDASWVEGKFEFSAAAAAIFGVAPIELTGSDAEYTARFVHPDDREQVGATFADYKALRKNGARLEYRIRHSNGTFRSIVEIVEVVDGDNPRQIEVIGTVHDVTVLKEAEQELAALRANMSDAIESINHAILLYDRDDRLVVFNRRVADHFPAIADTIRIGFRFERIFREAVDRGAITVPPGQDKESFIAERLAIHERADGEIFVRHLSDGRTIHVSERRSHNGGIVAVGMDMTERLKTEQQLREAQKMEAIGKLTGGLAHDFNNYIGVVIGNLDMIQENVANDPNTLPLVEAALNGATRAADLTRSLLAFARRQPLAPKVIDAAACVGEAVRLLRRTLGEQVEIKFESESGLWPIEVDQDQLNSSIVNLANNARDAMPQGGSLAIALRNLTVTDDDSANYPDIPAGAYVVIEVSDTGAGMAPETLANAFEPFFTTKGPGHGTGLGLSMVYGFVKQSGGHIAIYSEVGCGTAVRIYLPRATAPGVAVAATANRSDILPRGDETILVVEDNDSVRATVARQLADLGYRTVQAASADAALAILRQSGQSIDLLFTDMIMPGHMNGHALVQAAIANRPDLKALLTSGFPGSTLDTTDKLSSSLRLLSKPYRKVELAHAIRSALDTAPPYPSLSGGIREPRILAQ